MGNFLYFCRVKGSYRRTIFNRSENMFTKGYFCQPLCKMSAAFRVGADVDVSIEDVSLSGRVQIVFELDHIVPFPHMKSVAITFLEK